MDFLDQVLGMEEEAFRQGQEKGKEKARQMAEEESKKLGRENGFYIAREYGFIKGFTEVVNMEEHLREKQLKVIEEILAIEIEPGMKDFEINDRIARLRGLFKTLLAACKLNIGYLTDNEMF